LKIVKTWFVTWFFILSDIFIFPFHFISFHYHSRYDYRAIQNYFTFDHTLNLQMKDFQSKHFHFYFEF
jgi:hypothetical protein